MKTRKTMLALALVSSLLGAASFGVHAATATVTMPAASAANAGGGTPIDSVIDAAVAQLQMAPTEQRILREQLQFQFQGLSDAQQARVIAAASKIRSEESVRYVIDVLNGEVRAAARTAEASLRAKAPNAQGITPRLGGDGDLVFVATAGPCRVYDSRFGPGQLAAGSARQVWTMSNVAGYSWSSDQGGTGTAGSGNCAGTVFTTPYPVAVVASVTVVNTTASGALQAWNGGTTLSGGAVVNWNAGDRLTNTTVIPMDRLIAPYPGSGGKRDIGVNNNSGAAIDFVVDVVGYFIENQATALDCTRVLDADFSLATNTSVLRTAPACPTGYTPILGMPATNQFGVYTGTILENQCRINNTTAGTVTSLRCDAYCCRVPGR